MTDELEDHSNSSISDLERYKRVCNQIDAYAYWNREAFNRFIQLSLAVIGGFFWLKTQTNAPNVSGLFRYVRWFIPALAAITIGEFVLLHSGWRGFRHREARLLRDATIAPRFPRSGRVEMFRSVVAIVTAVAGYHLLQ